MKKTLLVVGLLAGAIGVYAQGTLNWNSQGNWLISVYAPDPANSGTQFTGDSSLDVPPGTTTYNGGFIGGNSTVQATGPGGVGATSANQGGYNYQTAGNFEVGLYGDTTLGSLTTDITGGTPVATTGISDGALVAVSSLATFPAWPSGTQVYLGLAAWYTSSGTISSYAQAVTAGVPHGYNESTSTLALGSTTGTPVIIGPGLGLTSFSLTTIPEPSTIALGVIGASAFLMRLRRKQ
jgi:hypothetical protein